MWGCDVIGCSEDVVHKAESGSLSLNLNRLVEQVIVGTFGLYCLVFKALTTLHAPIHIGRVPCALHFQIVVLGQGIDGFGNRRASRL